MTGKTVPLFAPKDQPASKAVEDLLGKQKESSPTPQTGKGEGDWSRDVASTAKALDGVDNNLLPEIIGEEGYLAKNGAPFMGGGGASIAQKYSRRKGKKSSDKKSF